MARNYRKKGFARGNKSNLIHKRCYRCECGMTYTKKPAQCKAKGCGRMDFTHFHSLGEAGRYASLLALERMGKISDLRCQIRIPLHTTNPDGLKEKIGDYIADFEYIRDGKRVLEDFKGLMLDLAAWKLRHVKAEYGIDVKLTKA